jgi:putative FmdB family regulatory protein
MTYEYACGACGNEWEAEQSIKDAPLKKCPKCGKLQAKRQISRGAGFILKGGGWYADGYGSSGGSASGKKAGSDSSGTESSTSTPSTSEKSSDAKSADSGAKASTSGDAKGKPAASGPAV